MEGQPVEDGITIAIAVPSHDMVHATFAVDLARMLTWTAAHYIVPTEARKHMQSPIKAILTDGTQGTLIHKARQILAERALESGADYLLFLDSDMRFPRDLLIRLLVHEKPIVGVNYAARKADTDFVAVKSIATAEGPGRKLITGPESTGLEAAEGIGFGAVLIHTDVLRALPDPRDGLWFQFGWDDEIKRPISEDIWFCNLARDAGFEVLVDHDLSKEIAHTGTFEYRLDHVHTRYAYEAARENDGADHGLLDAPE